MRRRSASTLILVTAVACVGAPVDGPRRSDTPAVRPGVEVLLAETDFLDLVRGKRVGLITNPTGVDHRLVSTIDLLHKHPEIELAALFGPEHGVRGDAYAGEHVGDVVDEKTGIVVHSLYGETRRPPREWLEGLDVMVYDIQDVGSRSYTYIYTMAHAMEECARAGIPFVVLDRPNPCGAHIVDGNILDPEFYSGFVGMYPIAYQYGMTPGETALMFNGEFLEPACDLTVVPMRGHRRDMLQPDTGLPFVPTSTHIPRWDVAVYYNLTGIIGEIRHVSIGVGYTLPFECLAAPWMDRDALCDALTERDLPGLMFRPISFRPRYGAWNDEMCHGVQIFITDYDAVRPVSAQIHFMEIIQSLFPEDSPFTDEHAERWLFDEVLGTDEIRRRVLAGDSAEEIIVGYQDDVQAFLEKRERYLIYD
jgi:uncharacterized protein YbbC (DUF1343 family)